MRKISKQEIMNRVYEERDKNRQPITKTEKLFCTIFLVVVLSLIIGRISNLFSK